MLRRYASRATCLAAPVLVLACASAPPPVRAPARAPAVVSRPCPIPAPDDPVVAVVGERRIRRSEIERQLTALMPESLPQLRAPGDTAAEQMTTAARFAAAVDRYADDLLVEPEARRNNLAVSEADLDAMVAALASERGIDTEALYAVVAREGLSRAEFRRRLELEGLRHRLYAHVAQAHTTVSDADLDAAVAAGATAPADAAARDRLRQGLAAQQAACEVGAMLAEMRRRAGVQVLVERPAAAATTARRDDAWVLSDRVYVVGHHAITDADVTRLLTAARAGHAAPGGLLGRDELDGFLLALRAAYHERGYLNVTVHESGRAPGACHRALEQFVVTVDEGLRYRVGAVSVTEVDADGQPAEPLSPAPTLARMVGQRSGEWFNRTALGRGVLAIQRLYQDASFASAQVQPEVTTAGDRVDLRVRIVRGPRTTIGRVAILGLVAVPEARVQTALAVAAGQPYSAAALEAGRRRVVALRAFDSVELQTGAVADHADQVEVTVSVRERTAAFPPPTPAP